jgi:photosystem II stability/assembly factor-like uncharacterized protein
MSVDGAAHWSAVGQELPPTGISALVVDPRRSSMLYAGTTTGVFESFDGGNRWVRAGPELESVWVFAIVVDPSSPRRLYAGTAAGVFRSETGGASWKPIGPPGLKDARVKALAIDPSSGTLYAATDQGVTRTDDAGGHWEEISAGLPSAPVQALLFTPTGMLFAGTEGASVLRWDSVTPLPKIPPHGAPRTVHPIPIRR